MRRAILAGALALLAGLPLTAAEDQAPDWAAIEAEIQERPGDVAHALPRLYRLLDADDEVRDRALRRLVALARLGVIPRSEHRLIHALEEDRFRHKDAGRLFQASLMVAALRELRGENLRTRLLGLLVAYLAGDRQAVADELRPLDPRLHDFHADRETREHLDALHDRRNFRRALAREGAERVAAADPAAAVAGRDAGALAGAIAAAAEQGLPASEDLGTVIAPWWLLRQGATRLDEAILVELAARPAPAAAADEELAVLAAWRRAPFAAATQRALLARAHRHLVAGRRALAAACFTDVAAFAADPALRAEARAGQWLCWAGDPARRAELAQALAQLAAPLEWAGKERSPDELRALLLGDAPDSAATAPGRLERALLAAPIAPGWSPALFEDYWRPWEFADLLPPAADFQVVDGRLVVSAPRLLACYALDDPSRPQWVQAAVGEWDPHRMAVSDRSMASIGPSRPAVAGGTIYTRWGPAAVVHDHRHPREVLRQEGNVRSLRQTPAEIAAFDLATGVMRWSTAGRVAALEQVLPVADPVVDGDRVYVFCKDAERQSYRFVLLCLDADDGALRWQREIGRGGEFRGDIGKRARDSVTWNTALHGAPPLVRDGIAYWATGGGFVVAIDLRDGLALWRHDYAIDEPRIEARGATPLLVDGTLVVIAKDLRGALGLDPGTGALRWSNRLVPADELVAGSGGLAVLRGGETLAALDGANGAVRWVHRAEALPRGGVQRHGERLLLAAGDELVALDLASGVVAARTPFPGGAPETSWTAHGERLLTLAPVLKAGRGDQPADGLLRRRVPRIHPGDGWGLLVSDEAIEAVAWNAGGEVRWRRHKPFDLLDARVVGDRAVILTTRGLAGYDAGGARLWQHELDRVVGWRVLDGYAIVAQDAPGDDHYDLVRLADGERVLRTPRPRGEDRRDRHWVEDLWLTGTHLEMVVYHVDQHRKRTWLVHRRVPLDGGEVEERTLAEIDAERWHRADARSGRHFWFVDKERHVHHVDLDKGTHRTLERLPGDDQMERHASYHLSAWDDRLLVDVPRDYSHSRQDKDLRRLYRAGSDKPLFTRQENGEEVTVHDGAVWLRRRGELVRLKEDGEVAQRLAIPPSYAGHDYLPVEWRRQDEDLLVLSRRLRLREHRRGRWEEVERGPNDHDRFALDRYAKDGALVARVDTAIQPHRWDLASSNDSHRPEIGHARWASETLWDDTGLWLSAEDGVHRLGFDRLPERGRAGTGASLLYRLDGRLAVDGRIDDWQSVTHAEHAVDGGRLLVSHDRSHLLIAVVQQPAAAEGFHGAGRFGGDGSWLQLELRGNRWPPGGGGWQFDLGRGIDGGVALRRVVPPGTLATVRYDHLADRLVYELAVPVAPLSDRDVRLADEILLEATCFSRGRARVHWPRLALQLHQYTTEQEAAGLRLAHALPRLKESQSFLRDIVRIHVGAWPEGRDWMRQLLAGHQREAYAGLLLAHLEEVVAGDRGKDGREPDPALLALAREAGVGEAALALHRRLMTHKDYRSQSDWGKAEELAGTQPDPEQAQRLLEQEVLALGRAPAAVDFLSALRRVRELDHVEGIALIRWFLERFPDHPEGDKLLADWWELARAAAGGDHAAARELMDTGLDQMGSLPWSLVYDFRRRVTHKGDDYIRNWHVVGPFPAAGLMEYDYGVPLPPRLQRITLKERYRMPERTLSWQPLTCGGDRVPLSHWLGNPLEPSIAYCVAWVQSPEQRQVAVELDADGPCRVWVNRQYVHRNETGGDSEPFHVTLAEGWNAIVVEQAMAGNGGWTFQLQLVERMGKGVHDDLQVLETKGHKSVTEPAVVDRAELEPGLLVEIYQGSWHEMPDFDLLEPEEVKVTQAVDLSVLERRDHIGLRFTGYIEIDELDFYTFSTNSDDGSHLYIGDQHVVDNGGLHGAQERYGTATLKPGFYPITITMFENEGGEHLEVFIRRHGEDEKQRIEKAKLWCRP